MTRGNPQKRFGGKLYTRATQGWPDKAGALRAAKGLRNVGYKAKVVYEDNYYRVYWRE